MNKTVVLVIGLAAGAALGAISGILFAPYKGSRTRKKIMRSTKRMSNDFSKSVHKKLDKLEKQIKNIKDKTETELKAKTEHLKNVATNNLNKETVKN
ncbi:YtxH domain-containing protein [Mangrovibacterium sp.]|uniref:YtxH domain-containing protein n=1 Tax=Mangrovibacterium sp. TaxID=1961364 RepID=UPI003566EAD2